MICFDLNIESSSSSSPINKPAMRLDSNLSRPRAPNGQSAPRAQRRHLSAEEQYDRWAAARQHARRHNHGEMTATAAAAARQRPSSSSSGGGGSSTGQQANGTQTFSPPRASALCYANSLDFVQFFCSDDIDSDDEDGGDANRNDSDMLTITRSMAFGGSIDTDDDDNHHPLHEGRTISLATNTFESTKSEISELQVRLDNDLRITSGDNKDGGTSDNASTPSKQSKQPSWSRQSSGDVTPYASNKKLHLGAAAVGTPRTCDVTPPRSNSSSLQSTPISRQDLPRKRLELSGGDDDRGDHIQSKSSGSNHVNVKTVGGHVVAATDTSRPSANNNHADGNDADEPRESGTELVLVHMSKSAAVL